MKNDKATSATTDHTKEHAMTKCFALFGVYLKKDRMADRLGRIVPEMFVLLKYTNLYVQKQSLFISCFFTDSRPDVFVKYRRIK